MIFVEGGEKPFRWLRGYDRIVVVDAHGQVMATCKDEIEAMLKTEELNKRP
jgi:hypothetical protein